MLLMIDNYDSFTYNLVSLGELGEEVSDSAMTEITLEQDRGFYIPRGSSFPGTVARPTRPDFGAMIRRFAGKVADPRRLPGPPGIDRPSAEKSSTPNN